MGLLDLLRKTIAGTSTVGGHRFFDLAFENVDLCAVEAGAAWVRSRIGVHGAAIDLITGEIRHRFHLSPSTTIDNRIHFSAGFLAANVERGEVACIAIESGQQVWRQRGELRGSSAEGFVLAVTDPSNGRASLVLVGGDGRSREVLEFKRVETFTLPPALVAGESIWAINHGQLVALANDGKHTEYSLGPSRTPRLLRWKDRALIVDVREKRDGPETTVRSPEAELATVPGDLFVPRSAAADEVLLAVELQSDSVAKCRAQALGFEAARIELTVPASARASARKSIAAIAQRGALAVFSVENRQLRCARVPLPSAAMTSVCVGDGVVGALVGKQLFVVQVARLRWLPGLTDQRIEFASASPKASGDPVPAKVVFAGPSLVLAEHPRLGRLNLKRASGEPALTSNDFIVLDAIHETVPGVWQVERWHKQGTSSGSEAEVAAQPLVLEVDRLPPAGDDAEAITLGNAKNLKAASQRLGFSVPHTLETLVELNEKDATFRRWLDQLSLLIEITGFTIAWEGSDPCLLGLAGNGGGDVISLYYYPPAHGPGASLPVVDWWHETNEVSWLANDFESYLSNRLYEARSASPEVVALILERLKLPPDFPKEPSAFPPKWFLDAHPRNADAPTPAERSERALVHRLRKAPEDRALRDELRSVYGALGWEWHRENLDAGTG